MTLEEYVYRTLADSAAVAALVGQGGSPAEARIYPTLADQRAALPYAVYLRVSGGPTHDLSGPSIINTRLQIVSRATTYEGAIALATAIRASLNGLAASVAGWGRITSSLILTVDLHDDEPRSFAVSDDYSIWHPS